MPDYINSNSPQNCNILHSPDVAGLRVGAEPVEGGVALQPLQVVGLPGHRLPQRRLRRRRRHARLPQRGLGRRRVVEARQVGLAGRRRRRGRRGEVVGELRGAGDELRQGQLEKYIGT